MKLTLLVCEIKMSPVTCLVLPCITISDEVWQECTMHATCCDDNLNCISASGAIRVNCGQHTIEGALRQHHVHLEMLSHTHIFSTPELVL